MQKTLQVLFSDSYAKHYKNSPVQCKTVESRVEHDIGRGGESIYSLFNVQIQVLDSQLIIGGYLH